MSKYFVIALQLLWATNVFAHHNYYLEVDTPKTEPKDLNVTLTLADQMRGDLIKGYWTSEGNVQKPAYTIQFDEYGLAEVISEDSEGNVDYQKLFWDIEQYDAETYLVWTDLTSKEENLYKIDKSCEGILLIDPADDAEICLKNNSEVDANQMNAIKSGLTGKWNNATYPFDISNSMNECGTFEAMKGAFLEYNFKSDGTYLKRYGSKMVEIAENGTWEISKDGEHVIFHASSFGDSEAVFDVSIAKILHLDLDEMVIEQKLNCNEEFGDHFCTKRKSFAFVR